MKTFKTSMILILFAMLDNTNKKGGKPQQLPVKSTPTKAPKTEKPVFDIERVFDIYPAEQQQNIAYWEAYLRNSKKTKDMDVFLRNNPHITKEMLIEGERLAKETKDNNLLTKIKVARFIENPNVRLKDGSISTLRNEFKCIFKPFYEEGEDNTKTTFIKKFLNHNFINDNQKMRFTAFNSNGVANANKLFDAYFKAVMVEHKELKDLPSPVFTMLANERVKDTDGAPAFKDDAPHYETVEKKATLWVYNNAQFEKMEQGKSRKIQSLNNRKQDAVVKEKLF